MTYDLAILGDPSDQDPDFKVDNTAGEGIYKLMQRVMILMLTSSSNPFVLENVGTEIVDDVIGSNVGEINEIQGLFNIASSKVLETLRNQTPADAPDDEQIDKISTIVTKEEAEDAVLATVEVIALSGDSTSVKVPISNLLTGK